MIGAGLLLSHVVVTTYTGVLLKHLHLTKNQLEKMATRDPLTGLPNRRFFMDRLSQIVGEPDRRELACLYLDLDGFKSVNDRYGHEVGDQLLRVVGGRVNRCIRVTDLLARVGGDEFTVVLTSPASVADAQDVAGRIIQAVEAITAVDNRPVSISVSVGISFIPAARLGPPVRSDELLRAADEAMYVAKRSGKGRHRLIDFAADPLAVGDRSSASCA